MRLVGLWKIAKREGVMDEIILQKHEYTIRAKQVLKRTAQDVIELSQIAHEYHEAFGYQEYVRWVKDDLQISEMFGTRILNVYKQFGSTNNLLVEEFQPSALYLLSAPSTPEPAREEALSLAESGEKISHAKAQEIIAKYKAEAETAKREASEAKKDSFSRQQTITTLEENQTRLRAEHNRAILTKQSSDADILRMDAASDRMKQQLEENNRQIEELKTQIAQPQIKEIEKRIEVEIG